MNSIATIVIISFLFFLFYVTKFFFTSELLTKKIAGSRARLTFGLFLLLYGINQMVAKLELITICVGIIFILFGAANLYRGYLQNKHYKAIENKQIV
ncbi:YtpI family protein [Gottfriedia acidiceleris]|uniref:YtpI family protein n=1 Tax=Gottfriedia acidiceleris TaxID=371036 RepID=A0ABY4JMP4_9BACI|nr:YtpI family protein [Gottfriedia acidiceleris]UPM55110.1 YtpI family protein [Gottfriedia acidiceleris]